MPEFRTIRQTSVLYRIPEGRMREWQKQGKLPGYYSGTRFYVNVSALFNQLNVENTAPIAKEDNDNV